MMFEPIESLREGTTRIDTSEDFGINPREQDDRIEREVLGSDYFATEVLIRAIKKIDEVVERVNELAKWVDEHTPTGGA